MKRFSRIAAVATGIVIALWMMAYWDVRQADMVCDIGQDPNHACLERFIELDRLKHIVGTNDIKFDR
jgi:hypothetical protein